MQVSKNSVIGLANPNQVSASEVVGAGSGIGAGATGLAVEVTGLGAVGVGFNSICGTTSSALGADLKNPKTKARNLLSIWINLEKLTQPSHNKILADDSSCHCNDRASDRNPLLPVIREPVEQNRREIGELVIQSRNSSNDQSTPNADSNRPPLAHNMPMIRPQRVMFCLKRYWRVDRRLRTHVDTLILLIDPMRQIAYFGAKLINFILQLLTKDAVFVSFIQP